MASRLVALDSPLESRSLWERQRDWGIALRLVGNGRSSAPALVNISQRHRQLIRRP